VSPNWPALRLFVYPDLNAAIADRGQAMLEDDNRGPPLLVGYGLSLWRKNVALIQAAPADDLGAWPVELDCAPGVVSQAPVLPRTVVEARYIAPLDALLGLE
jgi:hypothetical protein